MSTSFPADKADFAEETFNRHCLPDQQASYQYQKFLLFPEKTL